MPNQNQSPIEPATDYRPLSALAVWSLVLALLSLLLVCLGPFIAMAAVVCGHLATARIRVAEGSMRGLAAARVGLVIGYLSVFLYLVVVPLFVFPAVDRARKEAQEQLCAANVRQLANACLVYAESNDGYPPDNLDTLRPILGLSSNSLPLVFLCPASRERSEPSYEIETSRALFAFGKPAHVVLVREKEAHHHGRKVVAYADGVVEWVGGP